MKTKIMALTLGVLAMSTSIAEDKIKTLPTPNIVPSPMMVLMEPGSMEITPTSKIIVPNKEFLPLAEIFANEIKLVTGLDLRIAEGRKAGKGDIQMDLAKRGNDEAYLIKVKDSTYLKAKTYQGMAYATTTFIQSLTETKDGWVLPKMQIGDEPGKAYRGVLIDVARRWNSPRALRQVIQMARYYKVKYMVIHLTDDHAWTFPSTEFPKLGSKNTGFRGPTPRVYKKQELLDLVKYADERGVTIIPEIESPGHSGHLRSTYPETFGFYEEDVEKSLWVVDIANPKAYKGMETLINEACEIFKSSPYVHIGTDEAAVGSVERDTKHYKEFLKKSKSQSIQHLYAFFANQLNKYVKANGKRTIIWGDGPKSHGDANADDDIIRMVWTDHGWASVYLNSRPYDVISASWTPLYQVNQNWERLENNLKAKVQSDIPFRGKGPNYDYYIPEEIFKWNPYTFGGGAKEVHLPSSQMLGSQLTVWEQGGEVQLAGLRLPMAAYSERAWNIGSSQDFKSFEKKMIKTDERLSVLEAPLKPFKVGEVDITKAEKSKKKRRRKKD